jgi:hypothetical protein
VRSREDASANGDSQTAYVIGRNSDKSRTDNEYDDCKLSVSVTNKDKISF